MSQNVKTILRKLLPYPLQRKIVQYSRFYKYSTVYKNNREHIEDILKILEDDYSKEVLRAYIKLYEKRDESDLLCITKNHCEQYFDQKAIRFNDGGADEVFVDMGVCDGATSLEFAKRTEHNYGDILLFEPDPNCFAISKKNIATLHNVIIWNEACYDQDKIINFSARGRGDAKISIEKTGTTTVQAVKLDSKLKTVPYNPTFIKMDIEGAEVAALRGATDTIRRLKPRLAICIYHKPQDIWEIPMLIKEILPEYKLYIRHYDTRKWENDLVGLSLELVCYAVV